MRQQVLISGLGGQGILFLTRILAEAALYKGLDVITSETHGMAMRGGSVTSMVKVGGFLSPLIPPGGADVGLFLEPRNLPAHGHFVARDGFLLVNSAGEGEHPSVDASGTAAALGSPVAANLVILGFAAARGALFCDPDDLKGVIARITREAYRDKNLEAFGAGVELGSAPGPPGGREL